MQENISVNLSYIVNLRRDFDKHIYETIITTQKGHIRKCNHPCNICSPNKNCLLCNGAGEHGSLGIDEENNIKYIVEKCTYCEGNQIDPIQR